MKPKKQTRRFPVPFYFDWTYGVSIEKLKKDVEELERLGATEIYIETETFYDDTRIKVSASTVREETDEEFKARLDDEERLRNEQKQRDLEQLYQLKRKYENQ